MRRAFFVLLLVMCSASPNEALSLPAHPRPLIIQDQSETYLDGFFSMAWDPTGTSTFVEMSSHPQRFTPNYEAPPNQSAILWLRLVAQNQMAQPTRMILRNRWSLGFESVEIYRPSTPMARTDKDHPIWEREVYDPQPAFRIEIPPNQTQEIYLRIERHKGWDIAADPSPDFVLLSESLWQAQRTYFLIGQSAFFVFLLVIALTQLIIFAVEPDRSRLWYISMLLSYVIYFSFLSNFSQELVTQHISELLLAPLGVTAIVCSAAAFSSSYLDLGRTYPRIQKALFFLMACEVLSTTIDISTKVLLDLRLDHLIIPFANSVTGLFALLSIAVTYMRSRDGYRPARFLLAASAVMVLSALLMAAAFIGILPGISWGPAIFQMGAVIECVVLSIAVADRLRWIRKATQQNAALLQQRGQEIQTLRSELDHQLISRSRDLAHVLSSWSPNGRQEPSSGQSFEGRYQIVKPIGHGGMGSVFLVERSVDSKKLALKVLRGSASGEDATRFTREAEISARMTHPNLVKLFDVGLSSTGDLYIVMEFVDGGSLDEQQARFGDVAWALPILAYIARGLAALHAANVVHRDLKPSNILLSTQEGQVTPKIADFGISRMDELSTPNKLQLLLDAELQSRSALTASGVILGTPRYMPPEAIRGAKAATPSWDVFSFGVMAYEMLTGRTPFADVPISLALRGKQMPPLDSALQSLKELPASLAQLLQRCLCMSPKERPSSSEIAERFASLQPKKTANPTERASD